MLNSFGNPFAGLKHDSKKRIQNTRIDFYSQGRIRGNGPDRFSVYTNRAGLLLFLKGVYL